MRKNYLLLSATEVHGCVLGSRAAAAITDTVRMEGREQSQGVLRQADGVGGQQGVWVRLMEHL